MDSNIMKIHVELHKEIKENGNARSLRAALWRFAELAHMIKCVISNISVIRIKLVYI